MALDDRQKDDIPSMFQQDDLLFDGNTGVCAALHQPWSPQNELVCKKQREAEKMNAKTK